MLTGDEKKIKLQNISYSALGSYFQTHLMVFMEKNFTCLHCVIILLVFVETCMGQNLSSIVPYPTFTPTPILNNPAALEVLREWCALDSRCSEQYGQSITAKQGLFNTLFQTTTHSFSGTLYLESPLIEFVFANNMTWEQVNMLLFVNTLRLDILEKGRSCNEGETNIVNPETQEIDCSDLPWTQQAEVAGFNALGLAIEIAIFIVVIIAIVLQIWNFVRRRPTQLI